MKEIKVAIIAGLSKLELEPIPMTLKIVNFLSILVPMIILRRDFHTILHNKLRFT
jgi:hypothetical protein